VSPYQRKCRALVAAVRRKRSEVAEEGFAQKSARKRRDYGCYLESLDWVIDLMEPRKVKKS